MGASSPGSSAFDDTDAESGYGSARNSDPNAFAFSESDSEWKPDAETVTGSITKPFTGGADAKPDSESEPKSKPENVKRVSRKGAKPQR